MLGFWFLKYYYENRNVIFAIERNLIMNFAKEKMIATGILIAAIVLIFILANLTISKKVIHPKALTPPEIQKQFDRVVSEKLAKYNVPGAIVGVWVPGVGDWIFVNGKADIKTGQPPAITDQVRIGSVTKTFTATVVLQLAGEGKLSLEDKLSKYDFKVPNADKITIRQLLNMTSGLFNYTNDKAFSEAVVANFQKAWAPQDLISVASAHPVNFEPGAKYDYCNTNYILLGMIIEKVTGNKIGDEIQKRIINKIGLKNTYFAENSEMPNTYMHGYLAADIRKPRSEKLADITRMNPSLGWAAGSMVSNLEDMKIWVKALANGTLLTPEMHQAQITFLSPNTRAYGLGIMNGGIVIGHSGEIFGYNSSVYFSPKTDMTMIVFVNRYPAYEEGVSDKILIELIKILNPILEKKIGK